MNKTDTKYLETMRHSCEHVLHQAMVELYPGLKRAMGPATPEGFYHDFDYDKKINEIDFPKIEARMKQIIKANLAFIRKELSIKEARKLFKDNNYKLEWLDQIEARGEKATVYWTGNPNQPGSDVDLCRGPHLGSTGKIGPFKLLSIAGAYWHGDEKNKMLTRIYGTCFATKAELDKYLWQHEQAKKRDHRIIGQQLELFMFDDDVGQGLPLWLPKGAFVRHKIMEFAFNTYLENGYEPVVGPHIASESLWSQSGHLDFYQQSMYSAFGIDDEKYRLKPMNCPIHVKMYKQRPRSYKELPIRWTEMGTVYRYEKSGVLHGLTRVRGFTQDDAHIICRPDQLHDELVAALKLTLYILAIFNFKDFEMHLSTRDLQDKNKYAGSDDGWKMAEKTLINALTEIGHQNYILDIGGAVFYGPKIDVKVSDSIGRLWQLSTIQVDFNLPGRFKMSYINKNGKNAKPFMIHQALLGSLERFMGVYIEHTAAAFPLWLAPIQLIVIPISQKQYEFANKVYQILKGKNFKVELNITNDTMQAKVREATLQKIPYMFIIGKQEVAKSTTIDKINQNNLGQIFVSVRTRRGKQTNLITLEKVIINFEREIKLKK